MRRPSSRYAWSVVALSVALSALALPVTSALASEARIVVAGSSPLPVGVTIVNQPITASFDVVMTQPNKVALASFITSLTDTASPNYRHFLATPQFARRFGASASSVAAVRSYLKGFALRVGALSKGRTILHVSGSTPDIARAFSASVETVRLRGGVLVAHLTSRATLPAAIARDVTALAGLSSVVTPRPASMTRSSAHVAAPTTCASAGTSTNSIPNNLGYTVQQQAQLYGFDTAWAKGDTGVGQTIGVYELGQYSPGDLSQYFTCYGLSPSVTNVSVDGGAGGGGFSEEATLDTEEAGALAPGATIEVYTGPNNNAGPTDVYQQMADDNTATIITTSWGDCEIDPSGGPTAEQVIFEQMAAQGQTVVSAAGDYGSSDCTGITNNSPAVDDPASQPLVTGVGGLTVSSFNPLVQSVWNDNCTAPSCGSGGGGASQLWSRPLWQNAPGIATTSTMRLVPDLSVMADPNTGFVDYYTGTASGVCGRNCANGWGSIGGTSIGAPLVSDLVATAAQTCSVSRLGFINPTLYAMATTGFNDVTSGSNDLYGEGVYSAGPGYDMASGLGSPSPANFIAGLCPPKIDVARSSFVARSTNADVNTPATITLTLHDTKNNPVANAVVNVGAKAANGSVVLDGDQTSITGTGTASYNVSTDATGTAAVTVVASEAGSVALIATYAAQILSTTVSFSNAVKSTTNRPGKPTISVLAALVGGFRLTVRAPSNSGGRPLTAYQYSINAGATWLAFSVRTKSITNKKLARGRTYHVIVRAINANGPGAISASALVTTRR
jgi:subtilase family serine protease